MRATRSLIVVSILTTLGLSTAQAADIAAGKAKAAVCAACHGAEGVSVNPVWPNLAGQKEPYLLKQLRDFKSGARKDPLMSPQAAPLTETDMANLAAYFASLKPGGPAATSPNR